MGKVDHFHNRVEPFVALFWAHGIELYLPTPDPARWPGITPPPYINHILMHGHSWLNSQR